jgi:LmbE family N-acetylglucosaminyl deacetylase
MAIGAHPDDIEILAGGTLARYSLKGHAVSMCVLTDGRLGGDSGDREALARQRKEEAQTSSDIIGAAFYWIGEEDGFLFDTPDVRQRLIAVIRDFAPDLLIVHDPGDYHPDHRAAGTISLNARQLVTEPLLETGSPALGSAPQVLYMDRLALIGPEPEEWVDITDTIETKREMLACHRSQNEQLQRSHDTDYHDFVERQGALRGLQCGVAYAEGFRAARVFPVAPDAGHRSTY